MLHFAFFSSFYLAYFSLEQSDYDWWVCSHCWMFVVPGLHEFNCRRKTELFQSQQRRKTTDVLKASGTEASCVRMCKKIEKEAQSCDNRM